MGKVRENIVDDAAALAQWMGRKVKNHQPMSPRAKGTGKAGIHPADPSKVIYRTPDGKQYELAVRELPEDEHVEPQLLREVGR